MTGSRLGVFGAGRSGASVARAAIRRGAQVIVADQASEERIRKPEQLSAIRECGAELKLEWDGDLGALGPIDQLVMNPAVDMRHPVPQQALALGIEVISEVEFAYRISKAPIVAITGTNGKSTTTVMTFLALKAAGANAVLCGNIFGSGYPEVPLTDAADAASEDQVLVAEVSSFQLEWVSTFRPAVAGITLIQHDHLDRYDSFEQYAATKQRIFSAQTEDDFAVVRANDPVVQPPGGSIPAYRPRSERRTPRPTPGSSPIVLTFGSTGEHAQVDELWLTVLGEKIRLDTLPFDEEHNYQNAALASLLAYAALCHSARAARPSKGVGDPLVIQSIFDGLRQFEGLEHRMQRIGSTPGILFINNSMCTNPDAVVRSIQALKDPVHVLIGGVNKDLDFTPLRNYLANRRHYPYLFGIDGKAIQAVLGADVPVFETMEEAFQAATERVQPGEVIMLAPGCASTDQFCDFRHRGNVFSELAKEWLSKHDAHMEGS